LWKIYNPKFLKKLGNLLRALLSQWFVLAVLLWSATLPPITGSFAEYIISLGLRFAVLSIHLKFKGMNNKELRTIKKIIGG